eukprot:jgi/Chrzof1/8620/Cz03g17190.t1
MPLLGSPMATKGSHGLPRETRRPQASPSTGHTYAATRAFQVKRCRANRAAPLAAIKVREAVLASQDQSLNASTTQCATQQQPYPLVPVRDMCREIRKRVAQEMLAGGIIYLSAGDAVKRNGYDVYHKFRPDSNFFYLAGVAEPGFACLLDTETGYFTLVAPHMDADAAVWWGGLPGLDELAEQAGADRCIYVQDLDSYVQQHHKNSIIHTLEAQSGSLHRMLCVGQHASSSSPYKTCTSFLEKVLHWCRSFKTNAEVACLLQANRVSSSAHMAMWHYCHPGVYEYQLEAQFTAACMSAGCSQLGYQCIVGSGPHAAIMHYDRNSGLVGADDLVLVDAGAEYQCYTADITRTFPANGRFSTQQRDIYDTVLHMQTHALQIMKAGQTLKEIDQACRVIMLQRLQELGLVKGSVDALLANKIDRVFMPHGLGHFLGLDVHDVGTGDGPVPAQLQPGHVVTCEPGVYFMPLLMDRARANSSQAEFLCSNAIRPYLSMGGVRIEDNVVITADGGLFNLTMEAGMVKEADDIEAVMMGR